MLILLRSLHVHINAYKYIRQSVCELMHLCQKIIFLEVTRSHYPSESNEITLSIRLYQVEIWTSTLLLSVLGDQSLFQKDIARTVVTPSLSSTREFMDCAWTIDLADSSRKRFTWICT